MDASETAVSSKQGDAPVDENATVGKKNEAKHQEVTEGASALERDVVYSGVS